MGLPDDDLGQRVHAGVQAHGAVAADLTAFLADDAGKVRRTQPREQEVALMASSA